MSEYKRKPNSVCTICKKEVYRRPKCIKESKNGIYCSQKCYGISCRKEIPCLVCGTLILAGLNKSTCSKECADKRLNDPNRTYSKGRKISTSNVMSSRLSRKRFVEKRGNKCELCGYDKAPVLNIHHKLEKCNGGSDEEDNLIVLCRNCHGEIHTGLLTI